MTHQQTLARSLTLDSAQNLSLSLSVMLDLDFSLSSS